MRYKRIISFVVLAAMFIVPGSVCAEMTYDSDMIDYVMQFIMSSTVRNVTEDKLIKGALKGMFHAVDPYSDYFTSAEIEEFEEQTSGGYNGVGLGISLIDGHMTVTAAEPGGPADVAGIKAGDVIISVDGKDVSGLAAGEVLNLLKGESGSSVRIGIKRKQTGNVSFTDVVRGEIKLNPIKYSVENGIGCIKIIQFTDSTEENLIPALDFMRGKGIKSVVLDLRGNPGGLIPETIDVAQHFVPKGPIVEIHYKNAPPDIYESDLEKPEFNLAVIIDGDTASAAEILAGAIQDTGVGIIIGGKSYGKGSVQALVPLEDGSGFKITVAKYATPKGRFIDGIGIIPDVALANNSVAAADLTNLAPIKKNLVVKRGSVNLQVFAIQQRLKLLGYSKYKPNGTFGKDTERDLKHFQTRHGLPSTGIFDNYTYINMSSDMGRLANPQPKDMVLGTAIQLLKDKAK